MDEQNSSSPSEYRQAMLSDDCTIPSLRFPQKLWRIVNECKSGAIKWSSNGTSVLINYTLFRQEYLQPDNSIFKTINIASFIRQLNLYGFRKVSIHCRELVGGNTDNHDLHEFLHEHFRIGRLDLLSRVCRKTGVKKSLLRVKPIDRQPQESETNCQTVQYHQTNGMTRLQMCQIALSKALEQATKQYQREKLWLQLAEDNVTKTVSETQCKIQALEPNHIQIIFQDIYGKQEVKNLPIINIPSLENGELEEKIKLAEFVSFRAEDI